MELPDEEDRVVLVANGRMLRLPAPPAASLTCIFASHPEPGARAGPSAQRFDGGGPRAYDSRPKTKRLCETGPGAGL